MRHALDMGGFPPAPRVPALLGLDRARGDLYVPNADGALIRLPVGANGTLLSPDNTQPTGLKYATVGGITAPSGTGIVETTAGVFNPAATGFPTAAIQVSSFNLTGLTIPLAASFTTFNGTSGTQTLTDKTINPRLLVTLTAASAGVCGGYQALPATPYTIDLLFVSSLALNLGRRFGIDLTDTTKHVCFWWGASSSALIIQVDTFATSGATPTTAHSVTPGNIPALWLRITDDGVTRTFLFSANGLDYTILFTDSTNTFVTPTKAGFAFFNNSTITLSAAIQHFLITGSVLPQNAS